MGELFLHPHEREALAKRIKDEINTYCVNAYDDGPRSHLGASVIGHDCDRYLWLHFRHAKHEQFDGRMLRLFNRGHREEERWKEWYRGIGFTVWDVDPANGNQFRITGVMGHFGGSLDSIGLPPWLVKVPLLLEFKTHHTKSFGELMKQGVGKYKPRHYKQMCSYGKGYGFRYGIYNAINKNDDDIYIEVCELDWTQGDFQEIKAQEIITAKEPPLKIADTEAYWECKFCDFLGICHRQEPVEINCRSCKHAEAVANAEWFCHRWQGIIPKDAIPAGCGEHLSILR